MALSQTWASGDFSIPVPDLWSLAPESIGERPLSCSFSQPPPRDREVTNPFRTVTPAELKAMLLAGNDGLPFDKMSDETAARFKSEPVGGVVVSVQDTPFVYGGMRRTTNTSLQVKKERIPQEIFRITQVFPDT